ncbi:hypothetical protein IJV79_01040 [bacterium]|nr:hypothetical protein [bacterium]
MKKFIAGMLVLSAFGFTMNYSMAKDCLNECERPKISHCPTNCDCGCQERVKCKSDCGCKDSHGKKFIDFFKFKKKNCNCR